MAKNRYQNRIELLQGTLDLLILQTLQWGPQHGYGISQTIRGRSGEVLQVETGSLYPALHRLEKQGWVSSVWKQTESHQRAKYYRLTASGKSVDATKRQYKNHTSKAALRSCCFVVSEAVWYSARKRSPALTAAAMAAFLLSIVGAKDFIASCMTWGIPISSFSLPVGTGVCAIV